MELGTPCTVEVTRNGHPIYHENVIKLKREIIWTGGLPHPRVTILYGRSRLRLNICSASHFIHVSAYGYVSLTNKEDSLKVWYVYVVWKFWRLKRRVGCLLHQGHPSTFFQ